MKLLLNKGFMFIFMILLSFLLMAGCATTPPPAESKNQPVTELVKIETRNDITLQFLLISPQNPVASIILLAGNNGKLELSRRFGSISFGWLKGDFLVRNREEFAQRGLLVAVIDAPSDKQKGGRKITGGLNEFTKGDGIFRMSGEHAQDIKSVVSFLKNKAKVPIWLISTSMGTISATNAAIRIKNGINGLVLTSSKTKSGPEWGAIV